MSIRVLMRNPRRELKFEGPISIPKLLNRLNVSREAVLVIRNGTLVPGDATLVGGDEVEVRPVISGG